jgi:GNAT superfamily N-acetyltransferase
MNIRPVRVETDLAEIIRIANPYELHPVTIEQLRAWIEYSPPGRIQLRLIAEDEAETLVGYAALVHEAWAAPGRFIVSVIVDPACRGRGTGSALWEAIRGPLHDHGATRMEVYVREDDLASRAFAERRGFALDRHEFVSTLDLAAFDEGPYLPLIAGLQAEGIRFCSLADFPDTPDARRRLYDLELANVQDIPGVDTAHPFSFDAFEEMVIGAPWFRPEGQLLAAAGEAWVGLAAVSLSPETQSAYNEHTGVLRAYRGRKIAQALKVMAGRYARASGARTLSTDNDSLNPAILAINRKMGYRPRPGRYLMVWRTEG